MINKGRDWVIESIKFDPDRIEIAYHAAEDDVLVGGAPVLVSDIFLRLIMNDLIADEIDDMQDVAYDLLRRSSGWKRDATKLRESVVESQLGTFAIGDDDD